MQNKFKAKKKEVDGIKFASTLEAQYYLYLKEKGIKHTLQPKYLVFEGFTAWDGKKIRPIYYVADFAYRNESHIEVAPYTLVNKYDVSTRLIEVDDITSEIAKHPYNVQQELRFILNERKNKGFKTNGFKHLWKIYEDRFLNK